MFSAYTTLFRTPGAMKFSISGLIGRMPISMDSLALIFIVVAVSDSYALAGALSAVASIVISIANPFLVKACRSHWATKDVDASRANENYWSITLYRTRDEWSTSLDVVCLHHFG